jgi:hypothetical protein
MMVSTPRQTKLGNHPYQLDQPGYQGSRIRSSTPVASRRNPKIEERNRGDDRRTPATLKRHKENTKRSAESRILRAEVGTFGEISLEQMDRSPNDALVGIVTKFNTSNTCFVQCGNAKIFLVREDKDASALEEFVNIVGSDQKENESLEKQLAELEAELKRRQAAACIADVKKRMGVAGSMKGREEDVVGVESGSCGPCDTVGDRCELENELVFGHVGGDPTRVVLDDAEVAPGEPIAIGLNGEMIQGNDESGVERHCLATSSQVEGRPALPAESDQGAEGPAVGGELMSPRLRQADSAGLGDAGSQTLDGHGDNQDLGRDALDRIKWYIDHEIARGLVFVLDQVNTERDVSWKRVGLVQSGVAASNEAGGSGYSSDEEAL